MDKASKKWYECPGADNDIVLSTRVRLARDLADVPFPGKAKKKDLESVIAQVREALLARGAALGQPVEFVPLEELSDAEAVSLVERHLVSPEFISSREGRALLLSSDERISIMINEEDHLRIQVLHEGLALEETAQWADRIDTLLGETLRFAFDPELGYLTHCPTNLGTGMRASAMLHLPAMTESGAMERVAANFSKLGLTLRGTYGEGSRVSGAQYQLSNQITLGLSEGEAIENLAAITRQLESQERQARRQMGEDLLIQDKVDRAAGLLKSARLLSSRECSELLSALRFGLSAGLIEGVSPEALNALELETQPATLTVRAGRSMTQKERDTLRAQLVREACSGVALPG